LYNSDTADGSPWARKVVLSLGMVMLRSMQMDQHSHIFYVKMAVESADMLR
jgi:hypothetical protein